MENILIIGGSYFIGPIIIDKLLKSGYRPTIFNRGRIKMEYPAGVTFIRGDRNKSFRIKEKFAAVIDMCAYTGKQTWRALEELNFDFFIHMGTAAAYQKTEIFPLTEDSLLGDWPLWEEYNKGKVECEKILALSGLPYAILRPVYVLGPKNYLTRESFIYSKIKNNLPIVLPGNGEALVQFVFANEVAEAATLIAKNKIKGAFNVAGDDIISLKGLVEEMVKIVGKKAAIKYNQDTDGEKFDENEFPFANENFIVSNKKIKKLGIGFKPLFSGLKEDYESYYKKIT